MIEKPDLPDEEIITGLRNRYGVQAASLEFLPLGNESNTWVYRARTAAGDSYFVKLKKGELYGPSLSVPRYLHDHGIPQVVAPLALKDADPAVSSADGLSAPILPYHIILYPFILGRTGMETGLTDPQWTGLGRILRMIHDARLPADIAGQIQQERFVPKWAAMVARLRQRIAQGGFARPTEQALAAFWKLKGAEIEQITARALELGRILSSKSPRQVLCHTDIHTANVLVDAPGGLHIVDWDQPLFAPVERDLTFFISAVGGRVVVEGREQQHFLAGYGDVEIDPLGLVYYQYEWVVQEIGDFGERVFFSPELGDETKQAAVEGFIQLFEPGDVADGALGSEPAAPGSSPILRR